MKHGRVFQRLEAKGGRGDAVDRVRAHSLAGEKSNDLRHNSSSRYYGAIRQWKLLDLLGY